jgi:hypothetical protein
MADVTKVRITAITSQYREELPCDILVNRWDKVEPNGNFIWNELCDRRTLTLKYCPDMLRVNQWVRTNYGWVVDTTDGLRWYSTEESNKLIGGDPNSRHIKGLASDVKCWYNRVRGNQVSPLHVAYAYKEAFKALGLKGGIGTYYKGYDGSTTNGYNHIDLDIANRYYVCYKIGELIKIDSLDMIKVW